VTTVDPLVVDVPGATPHRVTVVGSGTSFEVLPDERLLSAARRAGIWLPFECGWGSCGTCKVTVVEGETKLLYAAAPAVDPRDGRRRRVLACQSTPTADLKIRVAQSSDSSTSRPPVVDHFGQLVAREDLGPDVARFRFSIGAEATYRPGQHAILDLGAGLRRCYSMAGLPGSSEVSFIAKRYAGRPGSERLFCVAEGDEVPMELPYGDMFLREGDDPVVLIAGGTGISAILAMTTQLAMLAGGADHHGRAVHVFYGAGATSELVCWDELGRATASLRNGHLHGALLDAPGDWHGTTGFVTTALAEHLPGLTDAMFYVAGPPPMTNATLALLRDNGIELDRIHYDSFG
jgi:toluene monooxygenase electron transfer component